MIQLILEIICSFRGHRDVHFRSQHFHLHHLVRCTRCSRVRDLES